ncbi:MAG: hypothetical protein ACYDBJ_05715 [Aggregatilineales bacterium]
MITSKLFRYSVVAALAIVALAANVTTGHAAGTTGNVSILVSYGGCDWAEGTVNYSGVNIGGDPFAVEVDIVGPNVFQRWSGGAASGPSGSESFALGWIAAPPATAGTPFEVQIWVFDINTAFYVPAPGTTNYAVWAFKDYNCTTAPPPASVGGGPNYYLPSQYVMGKVTVTTPLYSQASLTSQVVGQLTAGQTWFIVGTAHNKTWYQLFVGGPNYAWVPASTIALMGPVPVGNALYRTQ